MDEALHHTGLPQQFLHQRGECQLIQRVGRLPEAWEQLIGRGYSQIEVEGEVGEDMANRLVVEAPA